MYPEAPASIAFRRMPWLQFELNINTRAFGSDLSCRSLVTQDFLDYCCGVGGYVGLGGDGLTGDLDGDLA